MPDIRPLDVAGWFHGIDQRLFDWFLTRQDRLDPPGDLVELGAYVGKSAILIGGHVRPGETFIVCDLFEAPVAETANAAEQDRSYHGLTRATFERTYLTFHHELPVVVQAPSDQILRHARAGGCRFIHIDASHLYAHVDGDLTAAHALLRPAGIVAMDDYRSPHTPGVAAATWDAVLHGGLRPIALTAQKLYGTWGDAVTVQDELRDWASTAPDLGTDVQRIAGHRIVRITQRRPAALPGRSNGSKAASRPAAGAGTGGRSAAGRPADAPGRTRGGGSIRLRTLAKDVLPPVLTRHLVAHLARRAAGG